METNRKDYYWQYLETEVDKGEMTECEMDYIIKRKRLLEKSHIPSGRLVI